jgi:hypothetical protein
MNSEDWHVYAGMLKWARANAGILRQTLVVPSDVAAGEPYIYAHWQGPRGILAVRNPSNESKAFELDLGRCGAPRDLSAATCYAQYPCRRGIADGLNATSTVRLSLEPWELIFLEIVPLGALQEVVAIGARWKSESGRLQIVPDRGVTQVRILFPGGRRLVLPVGARTAEPASGTILFQSIRPTAENEWLAGGVFQQPEFTFHYPAEFGSEQIRRLEAARKQRNFRTVSYELKCEVTLPTDASRSQVLFLLQFPGREYCPSTCSVLLDGLPVNPEIRPSSVRYGYHMGRPDNYWKDSRRLENEWCWYLVEIPGGQHQLEFSGYAGHANPRLGVWAWIDRDLRGHAVYPPESCGEPAMPQYRTDLEREGFQIL